MNEGKTYSFAIPANLKLRVEGGIPILGYDVENPFAPREINLGGLTSTYPHGVLLNMGYDLQTKIFAHQVLSGNRATDQGIEGVRENLEKGAKERVIMLSVKPVSIERNVLITHFKDGLTDRLRVVAPVRHEVISPDNREYPDHTSSSFVFNTEMLEICRNNFGPLFPKTLSLVSPRITPRDLLYHEGLGEIVFELDPYMRFLDRIREPKP